MDEEPRKSNVVAPPTSFIGRDDDLAALHGELRKSRLLTIVGPPGAGKTRLGIEYVLRHGGAFVGGAAGGAWFCDLSQASSADDLLRAVAEVLEVSLAEPRARSDPAGHLASLLATRGSTLLVLDNFEQLATVACDLITRFLRAAPELSVIVTSRVRLSVPGEACLELGGLELAEGSGDGTMCDAVRLFVDRARQARRDFEPDEAEHDQISELVSRLDGLPLAIELAGARMGVLGPKQLLDRLGQSLDVLRGGSGRATTLRVTLDWSWKLLSPLEQMTLAQVSVFHGGFSLEAAEAVVELPGDAEADVVDLLEALRNSSLLRSWSAPELPGELRFGLLETVRSYAEEKLARSGAAEAACERHARYFERAGRAWASEVERLRGPEALRRLALELPNLSVVHRRALSRPSPSSADLERALSVVLSLEHVFYMRGPTAPCMALLDEVLSRDVSKVDQRLVTLGLKARGRALRDLGKSDESSETLEQALAIAKKLGDRSIEGRVLGHLGYGLQGRGRLEEALEAFREGYRAVAEAGDRRSEGMLLSSVGEVYAALGRLDEAADTYDRALEIDEEVGNRYAAAALLASRAELCRARGRPEAARADLERALEVYAEFGERRHEGFALHDLGVLHQEQGRIAEARTYLERALVRHREFGGRSFLAAALLARAGLDREQGQNQEARRGIEQSLRILRSLSEPESLVRALATLGAVHATLGRARAADEAFEEAGSLLSAVADPALARLFEIERGHADLAHAAEAQRAADTATAAEHRRRACERLAVAQRGPAIATRPAAERLAIRLLSRALEDEPAPPSADFTPTSVDHVAPVGRYELLVQIASGGMASVHVGRQRGAGGFERLVAIKRLHPHLAADSRFARAFLDEARLAALVRHPNVVGMQDVHQYGSEHLLVMDYVDGASLAEVMTAAARADRWIPRATALYILAQTLRGLHAAHEQRNLDGAPLGIVHRDASPHNVLLGADGSVRITDFGIAKARLETVVTEPGLAKGKFRYMAPEQARADSIDRRADVFAMGVVAWELMGRRRLFGDVNDLEVIALLLEPSFRAPSLEGPPELSAIIERALEQDRNGRWQSALEFAIALERFGVQAGDLAREPEIARLVEELCGSMLAERRRSISDALTSGRSLETPSLFPRSSQPTSVGAPVRTLRAGSSGRWFVPPGGERVSLERRRALRRVLKALVDQRLEAPGRALTQEDMLNAGWPGEKVRHDAGMLRVYNALSTLRKLGLREVLISRDDGYLIDPNVRIERVDEPGAD